MSYALQLVADARSALMTLPFDVQEEVFDILESTAADAGEVDPTDLQTPRVSGQQRLVYRAGAASHYVYLSYTLDHDRRTLVLERLIAVIIDEL